MANPAQDALNAFRTLALGGIVGSQLVDSAVRYVQGGRLEFPGLPPGVEGLLIGIIGDAEEQVGAPIFEALISSSLGLAGLGAPGSQEERAVITLRRSIGFAIGIPLVVGRLEAPLKALLGQNLGESFFRAFERLPEEIGLNFFLGETLASMYRTAVEQPLTEAIAEQSRPARLEWPQLRFLVKQHALSGEELTTRLRRLGWREEDIPLLGQLDRQLLSVGELQQLYLDGVLDEPLVRDKLAQVGYQGEDLELLVQLYLRRAETAGGDAYRSTIRQGFIDGHLTEDQYRAGLSRINVPQQSADLEVEAAKLTLDWSRHKLSASQVKALHATNVIDDTQATQDLVEIGYTETQANQLLVSWQAVKKTAQKTLDQARVLSYLVGGVITKQQAYGDLLNLNLRSEDAQLLVDHPTAWGGVYPHPLTEATVVAAFTDQDIDEARARELLTQLGVDPTEQDLQVAIAYSKQQRGKKTKAPHKTLTEAQVLSALNQGLAAETWAIRELVALGYADADAQLLVALEVTKAAGAVPAGWVELT
jgi:hypothetical protein